MREFGSIDLTGQVPAQICPACAAGSLHHGPTGTDVAHCRHNVTGAYRAEGRAWVTIPGIELHAFRELIARGIVKAELREDVARDLQAMLEAQARDATKH
jgi:hypothetical protein